ncbi:MAG: hypothetical protein GF411_04315 [Candidatus Lokiarchaeota archaeon]|nr:hypothetical protein [Candidatus Lokiarchaeota archaeon]
MRAKSETLLVISIIAILAASTFATSLVANPFVSVVPNETDKEQQDITNTDTFYDDYSIISDIPSTTTGSGTVHF